MIVAVAVVDAMDVAIDEIIDVSRVRDRFVAAIDAVLVLGDMGIARVRGVVAGLRCRILELMLVDMGAVHVMQMPVVQIIDVAVMRDLHVSAGRIVIVLVKIVNVMLGVDHGASAAWASPLRTSSAT